MPVGLLLALGALHLLACSRSPAELEPAPAPATTAPLVAPLQWEVPPTWAKLDGPKSGAQKAGYRIDKVGDDKEGAEVSVFFFGTGAKGDPAKNFAEWFGAFDGDAGARAKREQFGAGGLSVETVDTMGTYKVALGPAIGPNKKPPMQMVKEKFRLYGAVVKTPDRGNWFFKMVGPDETVRATIPAFRRMLESAR
jgi:hypothetical protein